MLSKFVPLLVAVCLWPSTLSAQTKVATVGSSECISKQTMRCELDGGAKDHVHACLTKAMDKCKKMITVYTQLEVDALLEAFRKEQNERLQNDFSKWLEALEISNSVAPGAQ